VYKVIKTFKAVQFLIIFHIPRSQWQNQAFLIMEDFIVL